MRFVATKPHLPLDSIGQVDAKLSTFPNAYLLLSTSEPSRHFGRDIDKLQFPWERWKRCKPAFQPSTPKASLVQEPALFESSEKELYGLSPRPVSHERTPFSRTNPADGRTQRAAIWQLLQ